MEEEKSPASCLCSFRVSKGPAEEIRPSRDLPLMTGLYESKEDIDLLGTVIAKCWPWSSAQNSKKYTCHTRVPLVTKQSSWSRKAGLS